VVRSSSEMSRVHVCFLYLSVSCLWGSIVSVENAWIVLSVRSCHIAQVFISWFQGLIWKCFMIWFRAEKRFLSALKVSCKFSFIYVLVVWIAPPENFSGKFLFMEKFSGCLVQLKNVIEILQNFVIHFFVFATRFSCSKHIRECNRLLAIYWSLLKKVGCWCACHAACCCFSWVIDTFPCSVQRSRKK